MKRFLFILLICSSFFPAAQELYPLSEAASTLPKGTLGIRGFSETYKEVNQWRNMTGLRVMYGFSSRLSVYLTGIASNHHGEKLPPEFPFHNTPERGAYYPYRLNGAHAYIKYRFLSFDAPQRHFRSAVYGEAAYVHTTHHETEPDLMMGDNSGGGGGLIFTYLDKRWAGSLTAGMIIPGAYQGLSPDPIDGLPDVPVRVHYGKALTYSLSLGYLLWPRVYQHYGQTNINLYAEIKGKAFDASRVFLFVGMPNEYYLEQPRYPPALQRGYFADLSPGVQFIFGSNLRIDISATFPLLGISYARLYPVYTFGIQRYIYFK